MSKRQARRLIAAMKPGTTVKEFMKMCGDFGIWFDEIQGTDLETASIKVIYPAEYYAIPAYITTWDLVNAFNNSDGTAAGFLRSVKNEIAI